MDRCFLVLLFMTVFFSANINAQSYGLIFSSFETEQEKRTCLDLSGNGTYCLKENADISFELSFIPGRSTYFGYIFRLVNAHNQNIDLLFNPKANHFYLVFKESYTKIDFAIDSSTLMHKWSLFRLHREGSKLLFYVNEHLVGESNANILDDCFKIFFGACNLKDFRTTDIPPMKIKNVRLYSNSKLKYYWPINEFSGISCTDSVEGKKAEVVNPVWIAPLHSKWRLVRSFTAKGNASVAFDRSTEQVYIVALDSIYRYIARTDSMIKVPVSEKKNYLLLSNQSFFNPVDQRLYNLYIDRHKTSRFDLSTGSWTNAADTIGFTEYWQANKFVAASANSLYVTGGYGQLTYKNYIQRFNLADNSWESIQPGGDYFSPRYLAALGATVTGDTAYILGGYGSTRGEQALSPKYLYDMLRYDVKSNTFKKMFSLKEPKYPFVFGNSLVLDNTPSPDYYALTFPNDKFKSALQLIRGNVNSPEYTLVGDTIPYQFKDIRSFADLYHCQENQQLLAVTLLINENVSAEVKIYSLSFPPNELAAVMPVHSTSPYSTIYYIIVAAGLLLLLIVFFGRKRIQPRNDTIPQDTAQVQTLYPVVAADAATAPLSEPPPHTETRGPVISLFGSFEVIDKDNNNITRLFTPLLQELFLLITIYTVKTGHGISTPNLNEILWKDKSEKDAKNNRSVNLAKLKAILEKTGNCSVSKESGKWMLKFVPGEIKIDLQDFLQLTNNKQILEKSSIEELLHILKRGSFLHQVEYPWLDDIKADVSNKVLDLLIEAGNSLQDTGQAEQMIEIANCIFLFDQVNENALVLKCKGLICLGRHSLAKNAYEKFAKDYRHMYGEDFSEAYATIIRN